MDERAELKDQVGETSMSAPEAERPALDRMRSSDLVETVANHIVPRLLLAHRMDVRDAERQAEARKPPSAEDIASLVVLAVAQDVAAAMRQAEIRLRSGMTLESLLLDWIAAAARLLGDQWLSDERSFSEVTLGLGTLHRMLATLRHRLGPPVSHRGVVVLTTAPGEQHTLAIHVLGDLLEHVGWEAIVRPKLCEDELLSLVATEPVTMVGLSVSNEDLVESLDRLIARVREVSLNRELSVVLGGAVDLSSHAESIGAVYCPSARTALGWLERRARISL
jgi:methanogenic corrinoid protein MtbC1